MSVDEYTDKFLDLFQYVGQAYDTEKKKARRYAMRLHPRYFSLIQAADKESFHSIVDAARMMEASVSFQGTDKPSVAQSLDPKNLETGDVDLSSLHEADTKSKKGGRGLRRSKRGKFWDTMKAGYSSASSEVPVCEKCGRRHGGVCLFGTSACFRCGQEGHIARECPQAFFTAQSHQTTRGSVPRPVAPVTTQSRGRGRGSTPSHVGPRGEGPSAPARIFTMTQQEADTFNTRVSGNSLLGCFDVYIYVLMFFPVGSRTIERVGLMTSGLRMSLKLVDLRVIHL
ncbi:uncharacterized protein LOC122723989 [Manihot esculenta]|uniref:uncharacterized protein LOC122723989 n=1 Tax=Manihot esculenta TaxID=3983 RepID=UPI001CC7F30C|nr:uncharacterized protein LOC122723989 [Manihot esculenta]